MQEKIRRAFSLVLVLSLVLTSIAGFTPPAFAQSQQTFVETFDNHNLSGNQYTEGSFEGNNGIKWNHTHVTGEQSYPIDGKGILLRRSGDNSKIVSDTITGGIGSFSVQMRKAFTGTGDRQIELFINGQSKGKSITFGSSSGEDDTVHTFSVKDINVEGNIIIEIRHITGGSQNRQLVIDNITWTSYSSGGPQDPEPQPLAINHTPTTSTTIEAGDPINISFTTANNEGTVTSIVYYKQHSTSSFTSITPSLSGDTYTATIPANKVTEDIQYYIEAADSNTTARHPESGVHTVTVVEPQEPPDDDEPDTVLTVAQGKLKNHGTEVIVEAYILEGFNQNHGLTISDTMDNPSDNQKLVVRMNTADQKSTFSPVNNSNAIGKRVVITGTRGLYSNQESIGSTTNTNISIQWAETQETKTANVTANPPAGAVEEDTEVTLSTITEDAEIYYTIDGSDPDQNSTKYEAPISIAEATTIKAIAYKDGLDPSDISTFEYTIFIPGEAISIAEARALDSGEPATVEGVITGILGNGQNIFYQDETAGLVARLSSSSFSNGWEIGDKIKVTGTMGAYANLVQVNVRSQDDILDLQKNVGIPQHREVTIDQVDKSLQGQLLRVENLILTSGGESGSYSVTAEDTQGRSIILRVENTVEAAFFEAGKMVTVTAPLGQFNNDYQLMIRGTVDLQEIDPSTFVQPVIANPSSGIIEEGTEIVLTTDTEGAAIYYTLDGSNPNTNSTEYTNPIVIEENTTIKAIAVKEGMENSQVRTFTYTIDEGPLTISQVKRLPLETSATIKGLVTAIHGSNEAYIQDENTGIQLFIFNIEDKIEVGDFIEVIGILGEYNGELQFRPSNLENIEIKSSDNTLPEAVKVTLKDVGHTQNAISVSQALDNYAGNDRTTTVRGIITDVLPNNEFAMQIADRANPGKTIDVALPAGYRTEFNPHHNPDAVGRMVLVTGQEKNYLSKPAIRHVTGWDNVNETVINTPYYVSYDVEGMPVNTKLPFEVTGKDNFGFTAKDAEGIVYIYTARATNFELDEIKVGDWYTVTGIAAYHNRSQIKLIDGEYLAFAVPPGQQDPRLPLVLDTRPADFTTIFDTKPLISARIEEAEINPAAIDYDNIKLFINGVEVMPQIDSVNDLVSYQVVEPLAYGDHGVTIHVPDITGKKKMLSWKFTIVNRDTQYNFYFGVPHAHTAYSDGAGTPAQAFEHARNTGLDYLIITDHSNWLDGVNNGRFEFDAGSNEFVEKVNPTTGEASQWWKTRLEAEAINQKYDDFLAMRGFEMTSSIWGHMNTINSDTYVEAKSQMVPLSEYYDWIVDVSTRPGAKIFNMFNHPNWPDDSFNDLAYVPHLDAYVNGIEVANGAPPYSYSRAEAHYWRALDNGWRVGAMNAQDNHAENWGDPNTLTVIIAENLETDTLIDAMNARRMYSTETRSLYLTFKGNEQWMGSVLNTQAGDTIDFEIRVEDSAVPIEKVQLITNGGNVLMEKSFHGGTNEVVWNPSIITKGGAEWFVVKVIQQNNKWGHSSPIFTVGGENDLKITGLKISPNPTLPGLETTLEATVSNMGIRAVEEGAEVKFYLNDPTKANNLIGTAKTTDRIPAGSSVELTTTWIPPNLDGGHRVFAVMTEIPNVTTVREISRGITIVKPIGKKVVFDGSHNNTDVPDTVVEIIEMLRLYGYEAVINTQKPITSAMLQDVDVLIINTPHGTSNNYTEAEQNAIAAWVTNGGAILLANKSNHGHNPTMLNPLMQRIGTNIRFNHDNIYELEGSGKYQGEMFWSVMAYNMPETESGLNKNMEAIRIFSGSSLAAAGSGGSLAPLANNSAPGLEIILGGNATSYNANPGSGAYVYNQKGSLNGEMIPIIAKENVGQGRLVAAGRHFYSDFEIGNDVSNTALTVQTIDWLAGYDRIRTIKDVRDNAAEGDIVSVRGMVTAPTDHFFDVIYIQDETSGVNVYGTQTKNNLPVGTEVIVVGQVEYFEGELEIVYRTYNYQVLYVGPGEEIEPTVLSTVDAMKPAYSGMLITTSGEIVEYNQTESYFRINDGSGIAHIHVDGYVGAAMERFKLGDNVTVTGNASVGSVGPRIRVRFFEDMVLTDDMEADFKAVTIDKAIQDKEFRIKIENARDEKGIRVNGPSIVKITKNDMEVLHGDINFNNGRAEIPLTLNTVGTQELSITIEEIGVNKTITLKVIPVRQVTLVTVDHVASAELGSVTEDTAISITHESIEMVIVVPPGSTNLHIRVVEETEEKLELVITVVGLDNRRVMLVLPKPINIPTDRVGAFHFNGSIWEYREATVNGDDVYFETDLSAVAIAEKVDVPQLMDTSATGNKTTISWSAVDGATYELIRREGSNLEETIISVNDTSYTDTVNYSTTYHYEVRAIKDSYQSDVSNSLSITTGARPSRDRGGSSSDSQGTEEDEQEEMQAVETVIEFKDIVGHWAEKYIKELVVLGSISGYGDGTFRPENNITRAEFVTILIKALDLELRGEKVFNDTQNHWAKKYVAAALAHGIASGYDDTTFGANDLITREQMAVMIVKAMKLEKLANVDKKIFADNEDISSWARSYIEIASSYGIFSGYTDNSFRPQANAKRAEAATVIVKALATKK
ncbi:S-layer homology domain-containing protein [Natronincola peptidivorans]|uniref:S-layer homology domain-containing protein n=1 Tax=Natronincola peptidivorans TaxID=426128 RepID=A0A1H9ZQ62_9FIRM|nr:S-layer homology domain-containing protein [Natronincola peptidivorans]SES83844.1 S-layer homology domain-containing protein [Natronincola peptidivorans]